MASRDGFFVLALALALTGSAAGQSVVSVRSGLLNYSEGAVFINNQPVKQQAGAYPSLQDGSDLLTQNGRAELLLTPSAYLRIGQNSAVRMRSNKLTDTKVELLYGSAMLDSTEALENCAITLIFKDRQIKISKPGKYRIDSEPPQFRVFQGTAEVDGAGAPVKLLADQIVPLDGATIVKRFTEGSDDLLDIWSDERHFMIASSLSNAQGFTNPADADSGDSQTADAAGLGAYLGYVPAATIPPAPIAPLAGIYNPYNNPYNPGMLGLGYGTYLGFGMYPAYPFYYPTAIYYPSSEFLRRGALGVRPYSPIPLRTPGLSPAYGYRSPAVISHPPGIGYAPRPIGGVSGYSPRPIVGAGGIRGGGGAHVGGVHR
jgi:hypothetical protein